MTDSPATSSSTQQFSNTSRTPKDWHSGFSQLWTVLYKNGEKKTVFNPVTDDVCELLGESEGESEMRWKLKKER